MRAAFIRTLVELADADERIVLLTGDLGFMVLEPFAQRFPERFFNVGVAEQNMVGLATGLAEAGFIPYVYSIATFASLRPYEFIRNGPVHHQFPVRVVGAGGGFGYGTAGHTHHSLEDVAVMRAQRDLAVVVPADHNQAATAIRATWDLPAPMYLRLGKDDQSEIPGLGGRFRLGRAQVVREGRDLLVVAMGPVASTAVGAAEILAESAIECAVVVVASVSPAPVEDLVRAMTGRSAVLTIEAHSVVGGVGTLVCEIAAEAGLGTKVVRCGVGAASGDGRVGNEAYLAAANGISIDDLVAAAGALVA